MKFAVTVRVRIEHTGDENWHRIVVREVARLDAGSAAEALDLAKRDWAAPMVAPAE